MQKNIKNKAKKKTSKSYPIKGKIIIILIRFFATIPVVVARALAYGISLLLYYSHSSDRRITTINLNKCFPKIGANELQNLVKQSLLESSYLIFETTRVWLQNPANSLQTISKVEGEELVSKALNDNSKGIVIISPHIGNWELLYTFLSSNFTIAGLYRPPKLIELEPIMIEGRQRTGGTLLRTNQSDVRKILKLLKQGGGLFLLPDQQPPLGSGVFARFYDQKAYTMTLVQGLVKRTDSDLMMATCIRGREGFELTFTELKIDANLPESDYATQMNAAIEEQINQHPEQYEWAYKRFKSLEKGVSDIYSEKSKE